MRFRAFLCVFFLAAAATTAACSDGAAPAALDPIDQDGVPESPDAGDEPLPVIGDPPPEPPVIEAIDASTHDAAHDAGTPKPPPPAGCVVVTPSKAPYVKYGLHPRASDALASLNVTAGRISQTIGNAAASAGTHAQDGTAEGRPYSAATDLSVRGMTEAQVSAFVDRLTEVGFVAFYRNPGHDGWPASEARHIHAIWVAAPMKLILRNQVADWHVGKNGLASHTTYTFKTWSTCWRDAIWKDFKTAN